MRKDSREAVYKILFAELFSGETDTEFDKVIFAEQKLNNEDIIFANQLLTTIREHKQETKKYGLVSRIYGNCNYWAKRKKQGRARGGGNNSKHFLNEASELHTPVKKKRYVESEFVRPHPTVCKRQRPTV